MATAAVVLCVAALLAVFRDAAARVGVAWAASLTTHTRISFGRIALHATDATVADVSVRSRAGEPIAYIPRIDLHYDARDLLPGSQHRYGLHAVLVEHPQITVIRHPDGTYNIPFPAKPSAIAREASPLKLYAKVAGGTLTVIDQSRVNPVAKHLYIDDVNIAANLDTSAHSRYRAAMNYREANRRYPIAGNGDMDPNGGMNLHHWTAAYVPLPRLIDFAINNPALRMTRGELQNVDLRFYGIGPPGSSLHNHLAASAYMNGVVATMAGVRKPVENGHGPLDLFEDGLTTQRLDATIAGIPVRAHGGIFHLDAPQFHLAMNGHGDAAQLKTIAAAPTALPIRGPLDFALLVEGSLKAPMTLIAARSPALAYKTIPLTDPRALVAFDGKEADVLDVHTRYGAVGVNARGRIALQRSPNAIEMLAQVNGPSDVLPYAPAAIDPMPLHGALLATAPDFKHIETHGLLAGSNDSQRLTAIFNVTANGVGTIGPFAIEEPNSSLLAQLAIDRPHNHITALVDARNFTVRPAPALALPGLNASALPPLSATLNGTLYADRSGSQLGMLGALDVRNGRYGAIAIDSAHARFGGSFGNVAVSDVSARGPFGTLTATGSISDANHAALEGHYNGSLSALSSIAGNLPAQGSVNAPIALVYDNGHAIAQVQDARFSGAAVRGVALNGLSATVGTHGKNIDVYAAHATLAQTAEAVAAGSMGSNGGRVALSVSHLDVRALRGAGIPLQAGSADVAATASGSLRAPQLAGAAVLQNGIYQRYPLSANAAFAYGNDVLNLRDATVALGPAFVALDGSVGGLALGGPIVPQYDLDASLRAADAHALIAMAGQPSLEKQYIEGSIDATVHVSGSGSSPFVRGNVSAPEGSVNGLAFRDMRGEINATPGDMSIGGGHVAIGSTAIAFNASVARGAMAGSLNAPRANLADFNDYFDTGDTLAGTGRLAVSASMVRQAHHDSAIASNGSVQLASVRYKRFDIGNTAANWHTSRGTIALAAAVGGASGVGRVNGTVAASRALNLNATAQNVDLGTWLPMLDLNSQVTGKVDATATVRGRYPDVALSTAAVVHDGTVGRVKLQRAQFAATATRGRGRVTQALLQIPYFTATGSGTFGFHARDPIDIAVHGSSPDVGALMHSVSGKQVQVTGALDTTLRVNGTRVDPRLNDDLTLAAVRYQKFYIPRIHANVGATRSLVTVRQSEIDLQKGRVVATGMIPVRTTAPFGVGPANAPAALRLTANGVDAANAAAALPQGTTVRGRIDGTMTVGGRVDAPQLGGGFALSNGYFVGPVDQNPISDMTGRLAFAGTSASLQNVHANVGGGTMTMNGTARVPNVRDIRAVTFSSNLVTKGAQFNSPQYFRGKADANVQIYRNAGGLPTVAGSVFIPSGRIPLTAFWNPKAPKAPAQAPLNIAFNLSANVGDDVRVQAPNVDVGARGSVKIGGTLPHPTLSGLFVATGGSVDFLHRFFIERASVRFDPSNGIMPYVNATATTTISNPNTYVAMHVTGLAPDNMNVDFVSDPSYTKSQILGMLIGLQQVGAVPGVQTTGGGSFAVGGVVQTLALGQLNDYFTRQLLEPMSVALGSALGFQNLQLTDDFTSGFGIAAAKAFGKHVTVSYNENLGAPKRQSLRLEVHRGTGTAFDLMVYDVQSPTLFGFTQTNSLLALSGTPQAEMFNSVMGTSGFSMLYTHKW